MVKSSKKKVRTNSKTRKNTNKGKGTQRGGFLMNNHNWFK